MKIKVDKRDIDKLIPVPVDLKSDAVDKNVVKNVYDELVKKVSNIKITNTSDDTKER